MAFDIKARIRKTGEERIYPEKVFENICDDVDNPLDFMEYVDLPQDGGQSLPPVQPDIEHQQKLVDELLALRADNQKLQEALNKKGK